MSSAAEPIVENPADAQSGVATEVAPAGMDVRLAVTIIVSALGYFVDIYDTWLFTVYRLPSLHDLGVPDTEVLTTGVRLYNIQLAGLVLGGFLWGVLGDKRGRTSVLFGSILVYSFANLANGVVHTVDQYALCRLFAGLGLAGEVGAAVTLISEGLSRFRRGYGSMLIYTMLPLGAAAAALAGQHISWRNGYLLGGVMGLTLLVLRAGVFESRIYASMLKQQCRRGDIKLLVRRGRWKTYLCMVAAGIPSVTGGLVSTLLPELSKATGMIGQLSVNEGIFYGQAGVFTGAVCASLLSQRLRSRKRVFVVFLVLGIIARTLLLANHGLSAFAYGVLTTASGFSAGYGAIFLITAAELFGTNLRATVSTTIPNVVRASMVGVNVMLLTLQPALGLAHGMLVIVLATTLLALLAVAPLEETFGKDLSYVET